MKGRTDNLLKAYGAALRDYVLRDRQAALKIAEKLGRQALAGGGGASSLILLHREALGGLAGRRASAQRNDAPLRKTAEFLVATMRPIEASDHTLRDSNLALRRMNDRQEETARRVSRALHDEASQLVAAAQIALDEVGPDLPASVQERLRAVKDLLDQAEIQLRHLSRELWPSVLEILGVVPALEFLADRVAAKADLRIEVDGFQGDRLPAKIETVVYRVVQEALENAAAHSRASRVKVRLRRSKSAVRCTVLDNGIGFARGRNGLDSPGAGLSGIRERLRNVGGTFRIKSAPGKGAELSFSIPLEA